MTEDDINQWKHNPVTIIFFLALDELKRECYETLTKHMEDDKNNILLQIGRLLGKISLLDDILETDIVNFLLSSSQKD